MSETAHSSGVIATVVAAIAFGTIPSCARLVFEAGGDPVGFALVRHVGAVIAVALLVFRRPLPRLPRVWGQAFALGLPMAGVSFCYMAAVDYIPVGLASLLFFTFPLMVALASRLTGTPLPLRRLFGLLGAFAGLILAVGLHLHRLDPLGVLLALAAAACLAFQMVTSPPVLRTLGALPTTLAMTTTGLILFGAWTLVDQPGWPTGTKGIAALGAAGLLFALAQTTFLFAIDRIGPVPAASISNLEPLVSLTMAAVLVGEILTPLQYAGAALVIVAVTWAQMPGRRSRILRSDDN